MGRYEQLLGLIDQVYSAAGDASRWPDLLRSLCEDFSSQGVVVYTVDHRTVDIPYMLDYGISADSIAEYKQHIAPYDPRMNFLRQNPHMQYSCDYLHTSEREMDRSDYYQWIALQGGFRYYFASRVQQSDHCSLIVAFQRTRREGHVDDDSFDFFKQLSPHLVRAVQLNRQLASLENSQSVLADTIDRLPYGVVILGDKGEVLRANQAAESIARDKDGFKLSTEGIKAPRKTDHARLQRLVEAAIATGLHQSTNAGGMMALQRPSGKLPYLLTITPFIPARSLFAIGSPAACLFIFDPESRKHPSRERVATQYGLTPSEAKLAVHLIAGKSMEQAAGEMGVSVHTTRVFLRNVFRKTQTNRQAELVRQLLTAQH